VTADPEASDGAPFQVLLNQLAGLSPGGDVELMMLPDGRLVALLVSPSQGTATMTELRTGDARTVSLGAGARHIRTYREGDRPIAVLFDGSSSAFHILDVAAIEAKKDKAFRTRHATLPIEDLIAVAGTPLFVATHPSSTAGVSIINADTDRITPFGTTGIVKQMQLSQPLGRLYLLTRVQSDDYVVSVDLATLHPEVAVVPQGSDTLLVLEDALTVATYSDLPGGLLTLWPSGATVPEATHAAPGFLLHQALDRAAEEVSP
jgi:hypothetical protein